jgi:hypothetical protein
MLGNEMESKCKHVAKSDDAFTARMRFHQSWYRRHVLGLQPGPNPNAHNELYGNLLRKEDGVAGWNFITKSIHKYVEDRITQDSLHIEPLRLRNNLLSSQPMCFNLYAPLPLDLELAARLIASLPGFENVEQVASVKLEYAPLKQFLLNDGTSFDAWIEYKRNNGMQGFIGIETKLTEPFSQKHYDFSPNYQRWLNDSSWWWISGSETNFSNKSYNQLWRNHLLSFALQHQPNSLYSESFSAVVYHPLDEACHNAVTAYSNNLLPTGKATLLEWSLDSIVERWLGCVKTREEQSWLQAFRLRYLDLEASEAEWQLTRRIK